MRTRDFFLHHLNDNEFENLVVDVCKLWFGEGVTGFAEGRDGGRDAKFDGCADRYPSTSSPWNGNTVIQAKHTKSPNASCSDSSFTKYYKNGKASELPKIKSLSEEKILDNYIVFTNRKLTSGKERSIVAGIKKNGAKQCAVIGIERINQFLHDHPQIARALPSTMYTRPFEFSPNDMVEVITGVHEAIPLEKSTFKSAIDFENVDKKSDRPAKALWRDTDAACYAA